MTNWSHDQAELRLQRQDPARNPTDGMLLAAAEAVGGHADVSAPGASLLPAVQNLRAFSATTAIAVARAAAQDGVATTKPDKQRKPSRTRYGSRPTPIRWRDADNSLLTTR